MKRRHCSAVLLGLLLLPASLAIAQSEPGRITGAITSAEGNLPLTGVRVAVLGTQTFATTNPQGRYTITIAPGTYRIRVSAIG